MRVIEKTNYSTLAIRNKIKFIELYRFSRFLFIITKNDKQEVKIRQFAKLLEAKEVKKIELDHRHTNKAFQFVIVLR